MEKQAENRILINELLKTKFHFMTEFNALADLCLYVKIENRGFYIILEDGKVITCQRDLALYGEKVMGVN